MNYYMSKIPRWIKGGRGYSHVIASLDLDDVLFVTSTELIFLLIFINTIDSANKLYFALRNRLICSSPGVISYDNEVIFKDKFLGYGVGLSIKIGGVFPSKYGWLVECNFFIGGTGALLFFEKETFRYLGGFYKNKSLVCTKESARMLLAIGDVVQLDMF